MFYNISWSTKFELERRLSFERADQIKMNFKNYFRGLALGLQKLTYGIRTFQAQSKITGSYKKGV